MTDRRGHRIPEADRKIDHDLASSPLQRPSSSENFKKTLPRISVVPPLRRARHLFFHKSFESIDGPTLSCRHATTRALHLGLRCSPNVTAFTLSIPNRDPGSQVAAYGHLFRENNPGFFGCPGYSLASFTDRPAFVADRSRTACRSRPLTKLPRRNRCSIAIDDCVRPTCAGGGTHPPTLP